MKKMQKLTEQRVRNILVRHLKTMGYSQRATIISELFVAAFTRRADVVLVNGKLAAFEIKGELDDLSRLDGQLKTFTSYFEEVTVVCAEKHTPKVMEIVDDRVGIWEVSSSEIKEIRMAKNSRILSKDIWLSYLPVVQLRELLNENGLKSRSGRRDQLLLLSHQVNIDEIRSFVLKYLKNRAQHINQNKTPTQRTTQSEQTLKMVELVQAFVNQLRESPGLTKAIPRRRTEDMAG